MTAFDLLDYRRRVAALYGDVRDGAGTREQRCRRFRAEKDRLFREHPASPIDASRRGEFAGLAYAPYGPHWRVVARVEPDASSGALEIDAGEDGVLSLRRVGRLGFELDGARHRLTAFWLEGYGGGLFVPFRDRTSGRGSYGGGRYLLDTVKHADLGSEAGGLVLDFNYAYAPSCAHDPRWACPLAPPENALDVELRAGELESVG
ncbi:MAG: DUF1684 domain-containing protein [Deinococcus-Thermus bacterium]|jgi:uncharacterized protein (DUF1684 family)|nr:DUF1684 domain-containing protein [Deinococcota bacterium]